MSWRPVALTLVLVGALLLRLSNVDHGLPFLYEPDEGVFVNSAGTMLADHDLNPHWFGHPGTTVMYLLCAVYGLIFAMGSLLGSFAGAAEFRQFWIEYPVIIYGAGRLVSVAAGVLCVALVYAVAARLFGRTTALLAATLIALSPLHVYYSKVIRSDMPMTVFVLLTLWFCLDLVGSRKRASYLQAGFFTGLGTATKYPGVLSGLIVVLAHVLGRPGAGRQFRWLMGAGVASLAGAFIGSPFLFLDFGTVLENVANEARPQHGGGIAAGPLANLAWYLKGPLQESLSTVGFALSALGVVLCVHSRRRESWLVAFFPVAFLLGLASLSHRWERWVVPLVPFLAILAAHAWKHLVTWIHAHRGIRTARAVGVVLAAVVLGPLLGAALLQERELAGADTRTIAREWILEHVPEASRVLMEFITPQLPEGRYEVFEVRSTGALVPVRNSIGRNLLPGGYIGDLHDPASVQEAGVRYVVLADMYDQCRAFSQRFPAFAQRLATYDTLLAGAEKLYEVTKVPGVNRGPPIRVYRLAGERGGAGT